MVTLEEFKVIIENSTISDLEIVQGYITHGSPFVFTGDEQKYFLLKKEIADHLGLNPQSVIMIGSAKLGFSINPLKLWKPFNDESDIDMVIISDRIFLEFWRELFNFNIGLQVRSEDEDRMYRSFLEYFFKGWLRPDLFPFQYVGRREWFNFFKSISYKEFGNNKITGAVFYDLNFYESYHTQNIRAIRTGG